jgi:hypothetical protein
MPSSSVVRASAGGLGGGVGDGGSGLDPEVPHANSKMAAMQSGAFLISTVTVRGRCSR